MTSTEGIRYERGIRIGGGTEICWKGMVRYPIERYHSHGDVERGAERQQFGTIKDILDGQRKLDAAVQA